MSDYNDVVKLRLAKKYDPDQLAEPIYASPPIKKTIFDVVASWTLVLFYLLAIVFCIACWVCIFWAGL